MQNDPIIKELHKIREDHLKLFNFDFKAAFNDLKKQEQKGGRKIAKPPVLKRKRLKAGKDASQHNSDWRDKMTITPKLLVPAEEAFAPIDF